MAYSSAAKLSVWCLVVAAVALVARAAPESSSVRVPSELRVISYNVQLLPLERLNKYPDATYRAARQAEACQAFDIVGLNEVFQYQRRAEILADLRAAWPRQGSFVVPERSQRSWLGIDSGLVLASRLPILAQHSRAFTNDNSIKDSRWDTDLHAAKGMLHGRFELRKPNGITLPIDVFTTHLESKVVPRRLQQYAMLAKFIAEHSDPARPTLLLGDLNTNGNPSVVADPNSGYQQLLDRLRGVRPDWLDTGLQFTEGTSNPWKPSGGNRIDHIFLSNGTGASQLRLVEAHVERFADERVSYLSDHAAVVATFEW